MNVFKNFDDLRHDDNSLNDLFKNLRNLNDLFNGGVNWDLSLLNSVDEFNFRFDVVVHAENLFVFVDLDGFLLNNFNFLDLSVVRSNLDDLFFDNFNFLDDLFFEGDLDVVVNNFLNDLMDFN